MSIQVQALLDLIERWRDRAQHYSRVDQVMAFRRFELEACAKELESTLKAALAKEAQP